ncbi:MAG TPA: D-alanine--D-alanine ligase [Thermoanaerobaculia bacterium]|nr:D-alanine--D-alanine ligase [Thermoanaerobaculia bacterium]
MKIAIVYDRFEGYEEYPGANIEAEQKVARKKKKKVPKTDRQAIAEALTELGHEPFEIPVDGRPQTLTRIARSKADFFFNLTESYGGDDTKEMHFAAFLDLVGKKYTGAGPDASFLAMDKSIAKKIIRFHDLYTPYSAVLFKGRVEHAQDIRFPIIVKPASEDASKGIDNGSVVNSIKDLMERIHYVHDEFDSPALLEEYIEGREIYAAVIGNEKPEALPLVELDLSKLPKEMPRIAGYEVKFDVTTDAYKMTKSAPAKDLDEELTAEIQRVALTVYQALKLRDYGRVDLRVTPEGRVYVLEANPNPWLDPTAEFMMAAKESGRNYRDTIGEILDHARRRY